MKRRRVLWIFIGIVIFVAALVSGFVLTQASAEDILVQALETVETITEGHAVVDIEVNTMEKDSSSTIEVWAKRGEDSQGAFRVEVLQASEEKAQGAVIVSNGETLWAHSPMENKVFVGTPEEAQVMIEEYDLMDGKFGQWQQDEDVQHEHPENAEEAVDKLQEYFDISKSGSETVAGETTNQIELEPIPEQMPSEYAAVGGIINLWIGEDSNLPLAVTYTGGSMGEFTASVLEFDLNPVDESLFTFEIPAGAEVLTIADLEPQSLTLEEAGQTAEFTFLTPAESPPGATLVDILDVRGALVQRYTLPEGGSFTIAQGISGENNNEAITLTRESQPVEVRSTTGQFLAAEDGEQVLLTWIEGKLFYSVAGNLTLEQALTIAESLQ